MHKRSDEALVAYLDGELDDAERRHVEAWIEADPVAGERLAALAASANLVRAAFDEIINEPVPERLIAAARGATLTAESGAEIVVLNGRAKPAAAAPPRRWWIALPVAASLFGIMAGGGVGYFGIGDFVPGAGTGQQQALAMAAVNNTWLDNAAGYYKLYVSGGDDVLADNTPGNDAAASLQKVSQRLPQQVRLPNLKPWSLNFRGAQLVVVDGKPAAQLVYTTDNKAIGPLTLSIGWSKEPDIPPTFDHRQDVNMLYWRHQGRAYVLVGRADVGYLWGIANDVAWQLDAI